MKQFNINRYLDNHSCDYKEDDYNIQLKECPSCGNSKYKFGISKEKNFISHCFVCGISMNVYKLVMLLDDVSYHDARQIVDKKIKKNIKLNIMKKYNYRNISKNVFSYSSLSPVQFPEEFEKLNDHIKYTRQRGLTRDIIRKFDLHLARDGMWRNRLIIPIKHNGILVGWQGRDITGKADLKIRSTKGFQKSKFIINYDDTKDKKIGILCEGPFDVMHAAAVSDRIGAFGIMGKEISESQLELLLKTKLQTIYIGLDPDFPQNVIKAAQQLQPYFNVKILPIPKEKDLGEMNIKQIKKSIIFAKKVPSKYIAE